VTLCTGCCGGKKSNVVGATVVGYTVVVGATVVGEVAVGRQIRSSAIIGAAVIGVRYLGWCCCRQCRHCPDKRRSQRELVGNT